MTRDSGERAEKLAEQTLRKKGLTTLCRNYRCRWGEIDLVMREGSCLVFVEVRYRHAGALVSAAESVSRTKRLRLIRAGRHYLMKHQKSVERPVRFDVVAISGSDAENEIAWLKDAFRP
ncbi:MAG: YraN family protein [Gammaproteobacteria bacterium]